MNKNNSLFQDFLRSHFFRILLLKWDAVTVSVVSIFCGMFFIKNPNLLDHSKVYDILSQIFTSQFFGFLFILIGICKMISIVFNLKWLRIISISLLVGMWVLFGSALLQNNSVNTIYIHCFGWAFIGFGVAIREWLD